MNKIIINSKTYGKIEILVDKEDLYKLKDYKLRVSSGKGKFYINCRYKGKNPTLKLTYLLTGYNFVDHKNGDTFDNRKCNLRKADYFSNNKNAKKRKDYKYSSYKGVGKKQGKWIARIQSNNKRITIGFFKTELEAAKAYDEKAKELHGEFAWLNFP